mmetsp:Transcript_10391/g.24396  ORF Transcript_10391/g.24396 Transcript_10391/m.24396 type:complete len:101 (-) Transcript_10391:137-439(-)
MVGQSLRAQPEVSPAVVITPFNSTRVLKDAPTLVQNTFNWPGGHCTFSVDGVIVGQTQPLPDHNHDETPVYVEAPVQAGQEIMFSEVGTAICLVHFVDLK